MLTPFQHFSSVAVKKFLANVSSGYAGKELLMFFQQLEFEFYDSLSPKEAKGIVRNKLNPNKIYPDDITFFLDNFLYEYKERILEGRLSEGLFMMPKLDAVHDIEPGQLIPFNALMSLSSSEIGCFDFFSFLYT